jgi:Na+-driven multidrug efflux pump
MWASWKAILYVGVPAAATQMIVPFSVGVITRIVSTFGPEAVAAYGVGTRIEALSLIGFFSIGAALSPFMGQNYGARNFARLRGAMKFSARTAVVFGIAIYAVLAVLARPLASIFTDEAEIVDIIVNYLHIMPVGYMFHGYALLIVSTFNAINRPITSVWLNIFRVFVLGIPLAYLGARVFGVSGIFSGVVLANVVIGFAAFVTIKKFLSICRVEMET